MKLQATTAAAAVMLDIKVDNLFGFVVKVYNIFIPEKK